jgi:hypothetical protein
MIKTTDEPNDTEHKPFLLGTVSFWKIKGTAKPF